jgi:allantoinase
MLYDCLIRRGHLIAGQEVLSADIAIADGMIAEVGPGLDGTAREIIDADGLHVFPGVIDSHVHFNEPGRTDWEGAATGSAALAAGGGVCFCDMPLNSSPPTLDGRSLDEKRAALERTSVVDFGLWGGLGPRNLVRLPELAEGGVVGFKAFMCDSGIDDFPSVRDDELGRGMEVAAELGVPVAVHAEDDALVRKLAREAVAAGRTSIRDFLAARPIRAEVAAIKRAIRLAEQTGCALHVVHVTCGEGVSAIEEARVRGTNVTCETCPHYLILTSADVERIGATAKCCPPVRDTHEREALWHHLKNRKIDLLASDHSPAPWSLKQGHDFFAVWGGISGCQTTLGLLLEEGYVRRSVPLALIARLTSLAPAVRFNLAHKGRIEPGAHADLALLDLSQASMIVAEGLLYRHAISPFLGKTTAGAVRRTLVRGQSVFVDGRVTRLGGGRFVPRGAATAPGGIR